MITQGHILHVADDEAWERMRSTDSYAPTTYEDEGFIHCCMPAQLNRVLERHFQDTTEATILIIDPQLLTVEVRVEGSFLTENFPHIYGAIDSVAVVDVVAVSSTGGIWNLSALA